MNIVRRVAAAEKGDAETHVETDYRPFIRIKPATTDLRVRLGFVVFVRGSLRGHVDALEDLWSRFRRDFSGSALHGYRLGELRHGTPLPESTAGSSFAELFGMRDPLGRLLGAGARG